MSTASTVRLIEAYIEESEAPLFLSSFFRSPPQNFHNTEKVEWDVMRDAEDIAVPLPDLASGARSNEANQYTNKSAVPPILNEEGTITAYNQIHRQPGQDPFQNPDFALNATMEAFRVIRKLEYKVRRTIELMASQVFQTGAITLKDSSGNTLFSLSFNIKSSHLVTTTTWAPDGSTGAPLTDIASLASVVRKDGKKTPRQLIFGQGALTRFQANSLVQKQFGQLNLNLGMFNPEKRGTEGATFQGYINIQNYRYEIWTYDGFYKDPQTGTLTPYVGDNKVILLTDAARYDLTYGAIPLMVPPEQRAMAFLPPRIMAPGAGLDLSTNAWFTPDGQHLKVTAGTRPLTIPTAIDTYGCLTVF